MPEGWEKFTASCFRTREGISYLRGKDTKGQICNVPKDTRKRVSCSWGAGIFVHNVQVSLLPSSLLPFFCSILRWKERKVGGMCRWWIGADVR